MDPDNLNAPAPAPAPEPAPAPPAPAPAPADPSNPDDATPAPTPSDDQPRDEKGRYQKRIDDLTRARGEEQREKEYWRAQALAGKAPSQAPAPDAPNAKPTADKFTNYEDFIEALTDWKAKQVVTTREAERAAAEKARTLATTWEQRANEFRSKTPDYLDVVGNSDVPLRQSVLEGIQESEVGPQLAYHLAKNPDVAARLNQLPEGAAMRELGRLEASLTAASAPAPAPAPAPAARTTNAPPPVKPVAQTAAGVQPLEKLSMDEYIKQRKAQGASWAR